MDKSACVGMMLFALSDAMVARSANSLTSTRTVGLIQMIHLYKIKLPFYVPVLSYYANVSNVMESTESFPIAQASGKRSWHLCIVRSEIRYYSQLSRILLSQVCLGVGGSGCWCTLWVKLRVFS